MCPGNSTDQILIMSRYYSTGHGHCSTYTRVNCKQYGGFPWKIHAKNSCVNFYTSFYTQTFYTPIWVYFYSDWFCLWQYRQVACISLQHQKCGWREIRNQHCGKTSFCGERENNLLYAFSYYDHATIANVMFRNQRFPWLLAEALFYM